MEFLRPRSTHGRIRRLAIGSVIAPAVLASVVGSAYAQVEVPSRAAASTPAPPSGAAAPAPASDQSTPSGTASATTTAVRLRVGSQGAAVRELQRALRARGLRYVTVDGSFGPQTRRAVLALQARFKLARTGVAEGALLRRLGLRTRAAASAGTTGGTTATRTAYLSVFPVLGEYSYFDDYGAPRHQGAHQGTDIMADKGTPLVAVVDGTVKRVQRTERGLGGIYIWLQRADGTEYYYAHMASIAAEIQEGTKVSAGQIVGTVGNTGDARYGADHLHFEIRLAGNRIVNPYTHLVAVDPARKSSAARSR